MGRIDCEVAVGAPPEAVFRWLRPEFFGAWFARANRPRMEILSPGGLGPGARVRISGESRYGERSFEAEVTAWDPPRAFAWKVVEGAAPAEVSISVEQEGKGTRVRLADRYRLPFPLLGSLLDSAFVRRRVVAVDRDALENLKALAEGRACF